MGQGDFLVLVLIDHRVPRGRRDGACPSLLTLPLGETTLLDHLASRLARNAHQSLLVVPAFAFDAQ